MNDADRSAGRWNILYRGPLSSCNYACGYCPFAKTRNTREELRRDAERLARFVDWVEKQASDGREIGVLFTPWGEALIHRAYQEAISRLSWMDHVSRVAIQTNLSARLEWVSRCDLDVAAFWATWHPSEVRLERFISQCRELDRIGTRYSVGVVGLKEALPEIRRLREVLDPAVYLWINALKRDPGYYTEEDIAAFESIDPLFRLNTRCHPSLGKSCRTGETSFTVDGEGDARRCHFVKTDSPIGNIYRDGSDFPNRLKPRPCPNETCGCHIGYVHLDELGLYDTFGEGVLERIPARLEPMASRTP